MSGFQRERTILEGGWVLHGTDGSGNTVRLVFGETELAQSYLGVSIGRHPQLADRVIDDPSVSRRHLRIGFAESTLFVEDLNSLNGTLVDTVAISCFQPIAVATGQTVVIGAVRLEIMRLAAGDGV